MFCQHCGAELAPEARFCGQCGKPAPTEAPVPPSSPIPAAPANSVPPAAQTPPVVQPPPAEQPPPATRADSSPEAVPKKKSRLGKIVLGLLAFIVIIISLAMFATQGLVSVVDEHLAALRSGDVEQAYALTSQRFRQVTPLAVYRQFVAAYPILSQHDEFSAGEREFSGETGTVKGTLSSADQGVAHVEFQMVQEGEQWRIQGFELN